MYMSPSKTCFSLRLWKHFCLGSQLPCEQNDLISGSSYEYSRLCNKLDFFKVTCGVNIDSCTRLSSIKKGTF